MMPMAPVAKKVIRHSNSHFRLARFSSVLRLVLSAKLANIKRMPMICEGPMDSPKNVAPDKAVMMVEKEMMTVVYDIGPHCRAKMFIIPCKTVTAPNATPSNSVNAEGFSMPPFMHSKRIAALKKPRVLKIHTLAMVDGVLLV